METMKQFTNTLAEIHNSVERIEKYASLVPLVGSEQQSQFLHNIYLEAEGIRELFDELLKEV